MQKRTLIVVIAFIFGSILVNPLVSHAYWVWSPDTGKWTNPKNEAKDTPDQQIEWAREFYDNGKYQRALEEFKKLTKAFPNSKTAAEGQYYQGLCYLELGDAAGAADAFKTLVDRYPYSERADEAIAKEYELAESMLSGRKTKFLGMDIMPAVDTAANLYKHIVRSAPYGPYGVKAQYRLGDAYLALGELDLAERAYQDVIDEYPDSEYAVKAQYQIAQTSYKASQEREYSIQDTDEAIERFESFKETFPESQLELEANEMISELRQKKAKSLYEIAIFYEERKKYKSARLYYNDILRYYPDASIAENVRLKVEKLDYIDEHGEPKKGWFDFMQRESIPAKERAKEAEKKGEGAQRPWWQIFPPADEKKDESQDQPNAEAGEGQEGDSAEKEPGKPWWQIF